MLELWTLGWKESSVKRLLHAMSEARCDFVFQMVWILGIFAYAVHLFTLTLPRLPPLILATLLPEWFMPLQGHLNPWLHAVLYLIVADFLSYWCHRWSHAFPFWWELHKCHHAATEFNISTGVRLHPMDVGLTETLRCLPLALLGAPLAETAILIYGRLILDQLQHSMIPWSYGRVGNWIIFSPIGHRIHHSPDQEHYDRNFGDTLVIWDRIFGTWYTGKRSIKQLELVTLRIQTTKIAFSPQRYFGNQRYARCL